MKSNNYFRRKTFVSEGMNETLGKQLDDNGQNQNKRANGRGKKCQKWKKSQMKEGKSEGNILCGEIESVTLG